MVATALRRHSSFQVVLMQHRSGSTKLLWISALKTIPRSYLYTTHEHEGPKNISISNTFHRGFVLLVISHPFKTLEDDFERDLFSFCINRHTFAVYFLCARFPKCIKVGVHQCVVLVSSFPSTTLGSSKLRAKIEARSVSKSKLISSILAAGQHSQIAASWRLQGVWLNHLRLRKAAKAFSKACLFWKQGPFRHVHKVHLWKHSLESILRTVYSIKEAWFELCLCNQFS